ncbi:hypothetical protein AVEN_96653-1 [Araneus ventricosus]|uniref:Uncharacterized protein n=1 Tax=Araneus ventricosus TaxID=182803 RepID=A0A4Y2E7H2_ARAVE|nr:hypothetical protein AVEN_96653-1 [Araneus ventricosus]
MGAGRGNAVSAAGLQVGPTHVSQLLDADRSNTGFAGLQVESISAIHYWYLLLLLLSQAGSHAGDKGPYQSLPLTSSPPVTGWTPCSLCRRFNEDFRLRHLLCSVAHDLGKSYWSLMILGDLRGSYNIYRSTKAN